MYIPRIGQHSWSVFSIINRRITSITAKNVVMELLLVLHVRSPAFMDISAIVISLVWQFQGSNGAIDSAWSRFSDNVSIRVSAGIDCIEVNHQLFIRFDVSYRLAIKDTRSKRLTGLESRTSNDKEDQKESVTNHFL